MESFQLKSHIEESIFNIFSQTNLQQLAVKSGFYKRLPKLLPDQFIDILLYSASTNGQFSLAQSSSEASKSYDISISKEAFNKRFNETTVAFVKAIFNEVISKQIEVPIKAEFFQKFTKVKIKDSTKFDLPERLKDYFKGFGGKITSDACVSIQYEFDLKTNRLEDLDITSALKNDAVDAKEKKEQIAANELIIRDLGYYSAPVIENIIKKEAFFLSKLKSTITVFDESLDEISFKDLYAKMVKENKIQQDIKVLVGQKTKIPLRMFVEIVNEEIYQDRIRKKEKENKKKGYQMTDEFKARARFNLMITNIEKEDLPLEQIYNLYKTRWQIELIFKTWKSTMGINNVHVMKYHRFLCFIYAKIILFLINNQITTLWNKLIYSRTKKFLSYNKCHKTLIYNYDMTRKSIIISNTFKVSYIEELDKLFSKNHWLEKRKNKIGFGEIFELFIWK